MDEIVWEQPPQRRTRKGVGKHAAIAAQLKARPGEWACIDSFATTNAAASMAWTIRRGDRLPAYSPKGSFEAVARTVDGEHRLYVRYVGSESHE